MDDAFQHSQKTELATAILLEFLQRKGENDKSFGSFEKMERYVQF
jgi:hypothetical protein